MSITDELRKWGYGFCGDTYNVVTAIADRIDAEHEKSIVDALLNDGLPMSDEEMAEHGWIRTPVDADGVPIRVGDVMDGTCPSGKHVNGTVSAIGDGVFWLSNVQFSLKPDYMHHYHKPTVEDVLREFAHVGIRIGDKDGIKAGEIDFYANEEAIAKYAAKLRLADDGEEQ